GKAQPGTQSRGAAFRMKDFRIHSERLVHRVCDADAVQKLAHEAAGCEHNIEALIQPAQIAAKRALSESAAKAPAKDLWQIRMIEGRDRNSALTRDLAGRPRRLERITCLDEARGQRAQQATPAARIQRQ